MDAPPPPLKIGDRYAVPDENGNEVIGVLESATVLETEETAYGIYHLDDGRRIIATTPLTEDELQVYRDDPDTFFGAYRPVAKTVQNYEECYAFLYQTYGQSPKEKLLEFMKGAPNIEDLKKLSQQELAEIYCKGIATQMMKGQKHKLN